MAIVNGQTERQEREACLSCVLPECIPDHPLCAGPGLKRSAPFPWSIPMCAWCGNGERIVSPDPMPVVYFKCASTGDNTTGYRVTCRWFRNISGMTDYERRRATGRG